MSSTPASIIGWLPTMPTGWPSTRLKPQTMLFAQCGKYSKNSPSSTTSRMTFFMSYGWFGDWREDRLQRRAQPVGIVAGVDDAAAPRGCSTAGSRAGTARRRGTPSRRATTNVATPLFEAWLIAPPSSSSVTSSPVTVFTTSGPVMNMWLDSRTMKMKSVIAGLYTAPPAHGPRITEICGTTPLDSTLR